MRDFAPRDGTRVSRGYGYGGPQDKPRKSRVNSGACESLGNGAISTGCVAVLAVWCEPVSFCREIPVLCVSKQGIKPVHPLLMWDVLALKWDDRADIRVN